MPATRSSVELSRQYYIRQGKDWRIWQEQDALEVGQVVKVQLQLKSGRAIRHFAQQSGHDSNDGSIERIQNG